MNRPKNDEKIMIITDNKLRQRMYTKAWFTLVVRIGDFLLLTFVKQCLTKQSMGQTLVLLQKFIFI